MPLAFRSARLLGKVIDGLIGAAPFLLAGLLASFRRPLGSPLLMFAITWSILYYFLADGLPRGQSLGKRLLGMQVIREAGDRLASV